MELNLLIASKRKEHGLSQEQLAEAVGVARQTVSKWETGETIPDVPSLQKLAIALEFSIDAALDIPAMQVEMKTRSIGKGLSSAVLSSATPWAWFWISRCWDLPAPWQGWALVLSCRHERNDFPT